MQKDKHPEAFVRTLFTIRIRSTWSVGTDFKFLKIMTEDNSLHVLKSDVTGYGMDEPEDRMEYFMHENREAFVHYALRDPEICVRYGLRLRGLNHEITGRNEIPISLSSIALKSLLQTWQAHGIDRLAVLGKQVVQQEDWNQNHGRRYWRKVEVSVDDRLLDEHWRSSAITAGGTSSTSSARASRAPGRTMISRARM